MRYNRTHTNDYITTYFDIITDYYSCTYENIVAYVDSSTDGSIRSYKDIVACMYIMLYDRTCIYYAIAANTSTIDDSAMKNTRTTTYA